MEKLVDKAWIDKQGNVLGEIGTGETQIAFDAHIVPLVSEISTTGSLIL